MSFENKRHLFPGHDSFLSGCVWHGPQQNYMKKLMAMNVMQVAVIYFYLCFAQKDGAMIPIQNGLTTDPNAYINPLPHGLMLTAIVVSLGTTGVAIALLMRIKEIYGSVEEVEVLRRASK